MARKTTVKSPFYISVVVLISEHGKPLKSLPVVERRFEFENTLVQVQREAMDLMKEVLLPECSKDHDSDGKYVSEVDHKCIPAKIKLVCNVWGPDGFYNEQTLLDGIYPDRNDARKIKEGLANSLISSGWVAL